MVQRFVGIVATSSASKEGDVAGVPEPLFDVARPPKLPSERPARRIVIQCNRGAGTPIKTSPTPRT
jgi:hypothetical protein